MTQHPLIFLIDTVATLYIAAVMIRLLLQIVRADFYNPVSQFLVKITNPILAPMRRFIPSIGRIDTASVVLLVILQLLAMVLINLVAPIYPLGNPLVALILSILLLLDLLLSIYFFAILAQVILSWINPGTYNPVASILHYLTEPLLAPARKLLPPISGIDFSPIIVLLLLGVLQRSIAYIPFF